MSEWQPIETAPEDGTECLLWDGYNHVIAFYTKYVQDGYKFEGWTKEWETAGGYDVGYSHITAPTHWQPLPAPPEAPATEDRT